MTPTSPLITGKNMQRQRSKKYLNDNKVRTRTKGSSKDSVLHKLTSLLSAQRRKKQIKRSQNIYFPCNKHLRQYIFFPPKPSVVYADAVFSFYWGINKDNNYLQWGRRSKILHNPVLNGADKSIGSLFLQLPFALPRNVDSLVLSDQEKAVISQRALGIRMCAIFTFDMKCLFGEERGKTRQRKNIFFVFAI